MAEAAGGARGGMGQAKAQRAEGDSQGQKETHRENDRGRKGGSEEGRGGSREGAGDAGDQAAGEQPGNLAPAIEVAPSADPSPDDGERGHDAKPPSPRLAGIMNENDGRDQWLYDQCCDGTPYSRIILTLGELANRDGKHPEWGSLDSAQSVKAAVERYCRRHEKPLPPRRQAGRRPKCKRPEM